MNRVYNISIKSMRGDDYDILRDSNDAGFKAYKI
ncbi:hypothetical protein CDSM653_00826 [Caldanaerobacter subterraneus subsp. pacificus DSM 12653]|uniref:Uncharacterized protein n=1 Tax=Caldanaerobacter subterraneus subsp. pacificus DSM 12653 TaxID=391606 RepID=A0A0F5PNE1_9THEO|nr:hypothetical protein CDSM653_00826 [Caldanaerobacter subterraneus subsp. pacificus DSM 12653]